MRGIGDSVGLWLYVIAGGLAFAEAAILVGMVLPVRPRCWWPACSATRSTATSISA